MTAPARTYPADAEARADVRGAIRERVLAQAELTMWRTGRSLKCSGEGMSVQHADVPGGCANDGSNCICECHDSAGQR